MSNFFETLFLFDEQQLKKVSYICTGGEISFLALYFHHQFILSHRMLDAMRKRIGEVLVRENEQAREISFFFSLAFLSQNSSILSVHCRINALHLIRMKLITLYLSFHYYIYHHQH